MLCFFPKRDDRKKFIHSKYIERSFYIPEESTDQELQQVMKNRPPGEDEDELFNDSAEVQCMVINTKKSVLHVVSRVYSRNWPMRAQWAPFCNLRGLFQERGPKKGATEKAWTQVTAESQMFVL